MPMPGLRYMMISTDGQVVEVTPSSGIDEEDDSSFWDSFNNIFGDGSGSDSDGDGINAPNISDFHINDNLLSMLAYIRRRRYNTWSTDIPVHQTYASY
jgi:hypothetical protein